MDAIFFTWRSKKTILANYVHLFPQKLAGRKACDALEKADAARGLPQSVRSRWECQLSESSS